MRTDFILAPMEPVLSMTSVFNSSDSLCSSTTLTYCEERESVSVIAYGIKCTLSIHVFGEPSSL